jgi:hypothetical protein
MGYYADTVDTDFVVPAANIAAALAAVTEKFRTDSAYTDNWGDQHADPADKLVAAVRDLTCFECEVTDGGDFVLSYHNDKWLSETETVLAALAPFATEGGYVRLSGEDNCLFGYRVVGGNLRYESGVTEWRLDSES